VSLSRRKYGVIFSPQTGVLRGSLVTLASFYAWFRISYTFHHFEGLLFFATSMGIADSRKGKMYGIILVLYVVRSMSIEGPFGKLKY
jgi:hypothetical protein